MCLLLQVASIFIAGRVDGVLLRELDEDNLAELGVASGIVRKKILLALAQLSDATYEGAGWSGEVATAPGETVAGARRMQGFSPGITLASDGLLAVSSSDDSDG